MQLLCRFFSFFPPYFMSVIYNFALQFLIKGQQKGQYLNAKSPALLTPQMDTLHPNLPPVLSKRRRNQEPSTAVKTRCSFCSLYKPLFCPAFAHSLISVSVCFYFCLLCGFFMVIQYKIGWYSSSLPSSYRCTLVHLLGCLFFYAVVAVNCTLLSNWIFGPL